MLPKEFMRAILCKKMLPIEIVVRFMDEMDAKYWINVDALDYGLA